MTAALLIGVAVTATAQKSNTRGIMLNSHISSASLAVENADTSESGIGFGFRLGWGITRKVTLFLGVDTASIQTEDPRVNDGVYGLMQADVGGIYTFRAGATFLPYVEIALSSRRITSLVTDEEPDGTITKGKVSTDGLAVTFGGGFSYYISPPVAISLGLSISSGHFGDYDVSGVSLRNSSFDASGARFAFGLTWYPMKN